jgi:uncharacterized protein (DUF1800 family)
MPARASILLAAALLLACAQAPARAEEKTAPPKAPALSEDQRIVHFLNRFTLGATPELCAAVKEKGMKAWLEEQFKGSREEPKALTGALAELGSLEMASDDIVEKYVEPKNKDATEKEKREARRYENVPQRELLDSIILRAVLSENQVREVSADFFRNHFAVSLEKGPVKWLAVDYEREAIRKHALGNFPDMLSATAHHPAMLFFLDNVLSSRPATPAEIAAIEKRGKGKSERVIEELRQRGLNENYARELMELHTLGVDNFYKQEDVIEVAKCLTGWTIAPRFAAKPLSFWFRRDAHCSGDKTVLGQTIKEDNSLPQNEGEQVLKILSAHEGTAQFLARKLCVWLVNDNPSEAMVKRIAAVFSAKKGSLPSVFMSIFEDPEFFAVENFQAKYKRPFEFVVSALRATGATISDPWEVNRALANMAEPLYRCDNPTGFYDFAEAWNDPGAMSLRWKAALDLANGKVRGITLPASLYADLDAGKPETWKSALAAKILCVPLSEHTSRALDELVASRLKANPKLKIKDLAPELVAGLLGSPEFQKQ